MRAYVSVSDEPAGRAGVTPGQHEIARYRGAAPGRPWGRLATAVWRHVRLAVVVRWRAASLDRELAAGVSPRAYEALAFRARLITGRRSRASVATGLAGVLRSADDTAAGFTAAIPPAHSEVLAARTVIEAVGRRLRAREPLTARGMAMLRELLTEPASPLYRPEEPGALASRLRAAAAALEPRDRWE
jgi:hypothetical protein